MKKSNLLFGLAFSLLLSGCDTTPTESSLSSSSSSQTQIQELQVDPISNCTISGTLIDIEIGRWLCVGLSYKATISFSDISDQTATIENSNPENIEITLNSINNTLTFNPLKAGDTILKIYDKDGAIRYRQVIKARERIAEDKIMDFLIDTDHFKAVGINGESKLTFLSSSNGTYSGYDSGVNLGTISFTYEYAGLSTYTNDEYEFTIIEFPNYTNDLVCTKFYVDFTGCMIHLMTANITVDVYLPVQ